MTALANPLASSLASQAVPGVLGFLVVAAMGLALYFLLRSMNKQLKKVVKPPAWREHPSDANTQAAATKTPTQGS